MPFYVSPGVYTREKDLSEVAPNLATATAAIVGYSKQGAVNKRVLVTNNQQFLQEFGTPTPGNSFHYSALAFLRQGNALYCTRVAKNALRAGVKVAKTGGTCEALTVGVAESVFAGWGGGGEVSGSTSEGARADILAGINAADKPALFYIFGKDPGAWNRNISVQIRANGLSEDGVDEVNGAVIFGDSTSEEGTFKIIVSVKDSLGNWQPEESWVVSRQQKTDGYGRQLYLEDVINGFSKYIVVVDNTEEADTVMPVAYIADSNGELVLGPVSGNLDGDEVTDSEIKNGWDLYIDPNTVDIRILIGGGWAWNKWDPSAGTYSSITSSDLISVQVAMRGLAEDRKDCIAVFDVPRSTMAAPLVTGEGSILEYRRDQNIPSSYTALYAPWLRIHDSYNDKIIEVPPSGYVAAQMAYNDAVAEPWNAPAGFNRGLLNVLGATRIFTQGERDVLYAEGVNCIQTFRGEGTVIWGQKTQQKKASALDRVNVRRSLIVMEKGLAIALRQFCFEINNPLNRFRMSALVEGFVSLLASRGAFQTEGGDKGYLVVVDETNNTPEVIDRNEWRVDVFVKPARACEIIQLQTIVTRTSVSFSELIARGALS